VAPLAPDPAAQLRTIRALWDEDFDLVHVHEPFAPGPTVSTVLLKPAPLLGTFHAAGQSRAYQTLRPILAWGAARLDDRVAVSTEARDLAQGHVGGEFDVVFNGIECDRFAAARPWPIEAPTVLFLGRHESRKGLRVLLESLRHLPADCRVWVAGSGPETAELTATYTDPRIEWLGRIDDAERDRRLAAATVFCAPSLRGESFGVILLEAMAAGTPVVASDIEGYLKVATAPAPDGSVPDPPAARLVASDDPDALGAALAEVLGDPDAASALRRAGLDRARRFDMELLCDLYLDRYRVLLDRASAAGGRAARGGR
jgi:phosphatidylinositol alpha-mannosyltransferase